MLHKTSLKELPKQELKALISFINKEIKEHLKFIKKVEKELSKR